MSCQYPDCKNESRGGSILGSYCHEHRMPPSLILEADTRWRAEWWDRLTELEKQRLIESPESERAEIVEAITAERGIRPPDLSDLLLRHATPPTVD